MQTNSAGADHTDRFALEVEAPQCFEGNLSGAFRSQHFPDAARQAEEQRKSMFRDSVLAITGHGTDNNAAIPAGGEIDMVEPGCACGDETQSRMFREKL